jgi:hypothetical protein
MIRSRPVEPLMPSWSCVRNRKGGKLGNPGVPTYALLAGERHPKEDNARVERASARRSNAITQAWPSLIMRRTSPEVAPLYALFGNLATCEMIIELNLNFAENLFRSIERSPLRSQTLRGCGVQSDVANAGRSCSVSHAYPNTCVTGGATVAPRSNGQKSVKTKLVASDSRGGATE